MRNKFPAVLIVLVGCAAAILWALLRTDDESPVLPGDSGTPADAEFAALDLDAESEGVRSSIDVEASELVTTDEGEVVFVKVNGPSATFSGTVRDARTHETIPALHLDIVDEYGKDNLVLTDAEGRFETTEEYAAGRLWIEPEDDGRWYERFEVKLAEARATLDLEVEIGPTYRLRFAVPEGKVVTDFQAQLLPGSSRTLAAPPGWTSAGVRVGETPWARFHPEQTVVPGPPWRLVLISGDGFHAGETLVHSIVGIQPDALVIALEGRGALRCTVRGPDGEFVVQVKLSLLTMDGVVLAEDGYRKEGLSIQGIPPGTYTIRLESPKFEPWSETITVVAGELVMLDAVLDPVPGAGPISGTVTTASGTALPERPFVLARQAANPARIFRGDVTWTVAGDLTIGTFSMDGVPPGDYDLECRHPRAVFEVTPVVVRVSVPASDVNFHVHDDVQRLPLRFEVTDAVSGAPIQPYSAWCMPKNNSASFKARLTTADVLGTFPEGVELDWVVTAEGYRLAEGGRDELRIEGEELIGRVALEPGWGAQFFVSEKGAGRYVPGLRILLDGEYAGTTEGEYGRLRVSRKARPQSVGLDSTEWRLAPGSQIDPESGQFAEWNWWAISLDVERRD